MKFSIKTFLKVSAVITLLGLVAAGCKDDDDTVSPSLTGESKTYTLSAVSNPNITGTVTFAERSDDATVITIELNGTTSGNTHVAHIHENTAAQTGGIILDLNSINGASGRSETVVTKLNDGTDISYNELLALNGYVNVHLSQADLATIIAQGDIGENELTTSTTSYSLSEANDSGITGTVRVTRRLNGTSLINVDLVGASTAGNYPIAIYDGSIETPGEAAITLNNYNGATGTSATSVNNLNNNTAISYDQLRAFNGHVRVGTSAIDPTTVAQGNIGSN